MKGSLSCPSVVGMTAVSPTEVCCLRAPFGWIRILAGKGALLGVDVLPEISVGEGDQRPASPLLQAAVRQFLRYFEDATVPFTLPLKQAGTIYQQRVWSAMSEIPSGQVLTYSGLARAIGSGPRAVASACKANRFPILIPCHRVVAAQGLGGYCGMREGPMLDIKRWLLMHEGGLVRSP